MVFFLGLLSLTITPNRTRHKSVAVPAVRPLAFSSEATTRITKINRS